MSARLKTLLTIISLLLLFQNLNGQWSLCTELKGTHLAYNQIGGIEFASGLQYHTKKNYFMVNGHLTYAVGNREFEKDEGALYTLVDGANREDYPLPGLVPGLEESAYLKAYKLNTAKTMDIGFALSFGREIAISEKNILILDLGINFSWIEESSIHYSYKGDLTNIFGTTENVYLVAPYTQKFFDLGPQLALRYEFLSKNKSSFGLIADVTWLTQAGFKYSFGPTYCVKL